MESKNGTFTATTRRDAEGVYGYSIYTNKNPIADIYLEDNIIVFHALRLQLSAIAELADFIEQIKAGKG